MENKQTKSKALERIKFIFYNIIFGLIGWLVFSFMIQHKGNFIFGFVPFLIYFWFLLVSNEKSKWDIFDYNQKSEWAIFKNVNVLSKIIIAITILILVFTIGNAQVFFNI